ncbi:MAG: hypothetical protein U0640_09810 [Phycisphaerales bacterium]
MNDDLQPDSANTPSVTPLIASTLPDIETKPRGDRAVFARHVVLLVDRKVSLATAMLLSSYFSKAACPGVPIPSIAIIGSFPCT